MKWGEVYLFDLGEGIGSEQQRTRPCVVVQNDLGNHYSTTTIIAPITKRSNKENRRLMPTQVPISAINFINGGVENESLILCEQLRVVDKRRMCAGKSYIGEIDEQTADRLEMAMKVSLAIGQRRNKRAI